MRVVSRKPVSVFMSGTANLVLPHITPCLLFAVINLCRSFLFVLYLHSLLPGIYSGVMEYAVKWQVVRSAAMELLLMARPVCRNTPSKREYISISYFCQNTEFLNGIEAVRFKGKVKCFAGVEDNSRDNLQ